MSNAIRWSPEQLEAHNAKTKKQTAIERVQALGRLPVGTMNKTEAAYAAYLECEKQAGRVLWYKFEGMKFRLADSTFYSPDFAVVVSDGNLEAHEVKGHWQDDARVKIKVAADMYPVKFIAVTKDGAGWKREYF